MTEQETKIIDESIRAYERMIKYYEKQICILLNKKRKPCCFPEKNKITFKVKCGEKNAKKEKRHTGKRQAEC